MLVGRHSWCARWQPLPVFKTHVFNTCDAVSMVTVAEPGLGRQVPCRPTNNIQLRILELRATEGGYLKLTLLDVAGGGALSSVSVRQYGTNVSACSSERMRPKAWCT